MFFIDPILHRKGFVTPYSLFSSNLTLFSIKTLLQEYELFSANEMPFTSTVVHCKKKFLLLDCEHFSANYMIFTDTTLYQKGLIVTKYNSSLLSPCLFSIKKVLLCDMTCFLLITCPSLTPFFIKNASLPIWALFCYLYTLYCPRSLQKNFRCKNMSCFLLITCHSLTP